MFFHRTSSKTKQTNRTNTQTKHRTVRNVHRIVTAVGMSLNAVFRLSYGSTVAAAADDDDEKYCNTNLLSPPLPSPSLSLSLSLFTIISLVVSAPTAPVGSRLMSFAVRDRQTDIQTDSQTDRQTDRQTV